MLLCKRVSCVCGLESESDEFCGASVIEILWFSICNNLFGSEVTYPVVHKWLEIFWFYDIPRVLYCGKCIRLERASIHAIQNSAVLESGISKLGWMSYIRNCFSTLYEDVWSYWRNMSLNNNLLLEQKYICAEKDTSIISLRKSETLNFHNVLFQTLLGCALHRWGVLNAGVVSRETKVRRQARVAKVVLLRVKQPLFIVALSVIAKEWHRVQHVCVGSSEHIHLSIMQKWRCWQNVLELLSYWWAWAIVSGGRIGGSVDLGLLTQRCLLYNEQW